MAHALQHHDPQVACGINASETQQKGATIAAAFLLVMIAMLATLTTKSPPAPSSIPAASLALSQMTMEMSAPPCTEGLPTPPPTKLASLALSPVEIFLMEDLLFAAMGVAVTGAVMMQGRDFDKELCLWDVQIFMKRIFSMLCVVKGVSFGLSVVVHGLCFLYCTIL